MRVACWFHTTYRLAEDGKTWQWGELVTHDFRPWEETRLLELFSNGDWEDGPRCLREILDSDDGEHLEPRRWLR